MRTVHTSAPLLTRIRARMTGIALFCVEYHAAILADQRRRVAEDLQAARQRQPADRNHQRQAPTLRLVCHHRERA